MNNDSSEHDSYQRHENVFISNHLNNEGSSSSSLSSHPHVHRVRSEQVPDLASLILLEEHHCTSDDNLVVIATSTPARTTRHSRSKSVIAMTLENDGCANLPSTPVIYHQRRSSSVLANNSQSIRRSSFSLSEEALRGLMMDPSSLSLLSIEQALQETDTCEQECCTDIIDMGEHHDEGSIKKEEMQNIPDKEEEFVEHQETAIATTLAIKNSISKGDSDDDLKQENEPSGSGDKVVCPTNTPAPSLHSTPSNSSSPPSSMVNRFVSKLQRSFTRLCRCLASGSIITGHVSRQMSPTAVPGGSISNEVSPSGARVSNHMPDEDYLMANDVSSSSDEDQGEEVPMSLISSNGKPWQTSLRTKTKQPLQQHHAALLHNLQAPGSVTKSTTQTKSSPTASMTSLVTLPIQTHTIPLLAQIPHPLATLPTAHLVSLMPILPIGPLLPTISSEGLLTESILGSNRLCLVLDLDETLVHSTFDPGSEPGHATPADLIVPLYLPPDPTNPRLIHVFKRPGVDAFLKHVSAHFEVVIFTASLPAYADPVIDWLGKSSCLISEKIPRDDIPSAVIHHRLYRDACVYAQGLYIKDLTRLGRPLHHTLLIDNSPASFLLQPDHAIAIRSWFSDPEDRALEELLPALDELREIGNVCEWRQVMNMRRIQQQSNESMMLVDDQIITSGDTSIRAV